MRNFLYKNKIYILNFVFAMLFGVIVFLLMFFLKNRSLKDAIDGCALAGILLLGAGLLIVITRLGTFDIFSYGFRQLFSSMFSKNPNQYNSMADYKIEKFDQRKKKKPTQLMFFLAGGVFLAVVAILEVILHIALNN